MTYKNKTMELVKEISLNQKITNKFSDLEIYVEMIIEKSKLMNLTGFKGDVLWEKGIYESISMMYQIYKHENFRNKKVLDIGAGVGFPSVPFKIIFPNFDLTIHDSNKKRMDFLKEVNNKLGLSMNLIVTRSEEVKEKEIFDIITARAVGSTRILAEISSKLLKIKGSCFFLKGPAIHDELKEASYILNQLNYKHYLLDNDDANIKSNLIILRLIKEKATPKNYPRSWHMIKNNK